MNTKYADTGYVFNQHQKKLLYTITKYVTFLSIAMISTWISAAISIFDSMLQRDQLDDKHDQLVFLITAANIRCIDCVINIICLTLQYPFADAYYKKYCICFGDCCTQLITRKLVKEAERDLQDLGNPRNLGNVHSDTAGREDVNDHNTVPGTLEKTESVGSVVSSIGTNAEDVLNETMNEVLRMPTEPKEKGFDRV